MTQRNKRGASPKIVGWREWLAMPDLGVEAIRAKVDTGARSSALHAFNIERFQNDGSDWVRFLVHPQQRNNRETVRCEAPIHDERTVRSSNGHETDRIVIRTRVEVLGECFAIDLTLTNRDAMGFRMLLGREATRRRFLVDPSRSYLGERPSFKNE